MRLRITICYCPNRKPKEMRELRSLSFGLRQGGPSVHNPLYRVRSGQYTYHFLLLQRTTT